MSAWLLAAIALLPPLAVVFHVGLSGRTGDRLVALQLATAIVVFVLVLMSFALDQSSFLDLPLTLAFLTLPGTLVFAHFLERWL